MHLVLLVTSIALAGCSPVLGQGVLPAESSISLDPLVTLVGCLRDAKPGYCLQRRALGFFESWLTNSGDEDDVIPNDDEDGGVKLPAGLSPYWSKMVDSVAERIAGIYDDKDEDEDEDEQSAEESEARNLVQDSSLSQVEARGKYKKDKKVKVAMTVILLIIYFIKSQLFYMFDKVARTAIFAKLIFALKIFVIVKLLELKRYIWWVKEEKKEVHEEVSVHDHHYDEVPGGHYGAPIDSPPPWSGGWPWHSRADAHAVAYHAQAPASASASAQRPHLS
ncbi:uncharacterized protein LOC106668301 isoform X2 [Cimex lectularius]|uniref:Osiris n=1 Tax=Cimex lectularius TaxID=79782 RepID=A0A8I6RW19_CIMLE|nr:uncharacterized protein LOC106668301 isoform X2 [Cimex lectularius]